MHATVHQVSILGENTEGQWGGKAIWKITYLEADVSKAAGKGNLFKSR